MSNSVKLLFIEENVAYSGIYIFQYITIQIQLKYGNWSAYFYPYTNIHGIQETISTHTFMMGEKGASKQQIRRMINKNII